MVVYQQPESLATRFLWGHIYPGVKRAGDGRLGCWLDRSRFARPRHVTPRPKLIYTRFGGSVTVTVDLSPILIDMSLKTHTVQRSCDYQMYW